MKRPNRSGSVIKLGGKRRKPYAARITIGTYINSKGNVAQKYKYVGYFEKQADALAALEKYNVGGDIPKKPDGQRFSEIYKLWYEEKKRALLSRPTVEADKLAYKRLSPLHDMVFSKIRLADLETVIAPYAHMSSTTLASLTIPLKGMYKYAMRHDLVDKDYAALLEVTAEHTRTNPHKPFTDEEVQKLWEYKDYLPARVLLILLYSGMRIMEYLSMPSSAYHGSYLIGGEKTEAGRNRIIPLHKDIIPLISTDKDYLVVSERTGKPYTYGIFVRRFRDFMARIGMDHTLHDARHTTASKLEAAGVNPYHVKLILGHSVTDVTFGVYTHVNPETLIEDINRIRF